jgi:hypothetical protein
MRQSRRKRRRRTSAYSDVDRSHSLVYRHSIFIQHQKRARFRRVHVLRGLQTTSKLHLSADKSTLSAVAGGYHHLHFNSARGVARNVVLNRSDGVLRAGTAHALQRVVTHESHATGNRLHRTDREVPRLHPPHHPTATTPSSRGAHARRSGDVVVVLSAGAKARKRVRSAANSVQSPPLPHARKYL